ncbi:MAG: ASCH domain-containing protein [Candidatus Paceibacterota bacterium]
MDHVAIMKKSWKLIPKIIAGEKTIESRWYQTRRAPWNCIKKGDRIFFKNTGEVVSVCARVSRVLQFEIKNITEVEKIVALYGKKICLRHTDPHLWRALPQYCILVYLQNPKKIKTPFQINKKGFGSATAWIVAKNIKMIQM